MNPVSAFWQKICVPLDGYLWHKNIYHHLVRPTLRNQILASGACILAGAALYAAFPGVFWFGAGLVCMTWIVWSWARFFLNTNIGEFSAAFLRSILLRFVLRLIILAMLLYLALAWCKAPAPAILAGMIGGAVLALASYAINMAGRS